MSAAAAVAAFGPEWPGAGSWEWVGADTASLLAPRFRTRTFAETVPSCDVAVFVKFLPPADVLRALRRGGASAVYAPVDRYGSAAEIDAEAESLRLCERVVVHCERLRKYFAPYAPVEYLDHHVKFAAPLRTEFRTDGPLLWAGVRTNLPPLVDWVNAHDLPGELWVLTNPEGPGRVPPPEEYGFTGRNRVEIGAWSPERQREWTALCRGALDVKGEDFRARHKPPAKAVDFLASGVPLAMPADASSAEHLARLGFELAHPEDAGYWLSREYWEQSRRFGAALRELLAPGRLAVRWRRLLEDVLAGRVRD